MIWKQGRRRRLVGKKEREGRDERTKTHIRIQTRRNADLIDGTIELRMRPQVTSYDELGEHLVLDRIDGILHDAEDVESRENGFREFDVLLEGNGRVVSTSDRVGSGDDGASSLEGGDDSGFGDGDGLLLHGFVNGGSILRGDASRSSKRSVNFSFSSNSNHLGKKTTRENRLT